MPFVHNDYVYKHERLHDEQVQLIQEELSGSQSLTLINGYDKTVMHRAFKRQLKRTINRSDVAIITLNGGKCCWTTADQCDVENELLHQNRTPIRAASSAIQAIYDLGFRHIIVIGHKQVAEGQTIGCSKLSLSLQIRGTPNSKPNADALVQSIRTGGLNIHSTQRIQTDPQKWKDYCKYIEVNEELVTLFQDKSPEEQQLIAEQAYFSLPSLTVLHGDYQPVRKIVQTTDVSSHYFEIPIKMYESLFTYNCVDNTAPLYAYVRDAVKNQSWYTNQKLNGKKVNGSPTDKLQGRGNDVQIHVNADPQSKEARVHPLVFWKRDDKICVRYTYRHEAGQTHNYYGQLQSFAKTKDIVLELAV